MQQRRETEHTHTNERSNQGEHRSSPKERKDRVLTKGTPSMVGSIADAVSVKDEDLFLIVQPNGSMPLHHDHGLGLYYHDCRYLKGYTVRLDGIEPQVLVADESRGFAAEFQLTNPDLRDQSGKLIPKESLGIRWERVLDGSALLLHERMTVHNFGLEPVHFDMRIDLACGFEDVFDVRGLLDERPGTPYRPLWSDDGRLVFAYDGKDGITRTLQVTFGPGELRRHENGATRSFSVPARGAESWDLRLRIVDTDTSVKRVKTRQSVLDESDEDARRWVHEHPRLETDGALLHRVFERSLRDLRMLRSRRFGHAFFAAGVPWFATLFGRDSILSAYQLLAFDWHTAEETLRLLAKMQGTRVNEWRDEQPGKILHELRVGELAHLDEVPHNPYYGTVDATPLFLILLHAHARWRGSTALFTELRACAESALAWIDRYSGMQEGGYVTYRSASRKGLINQGWKDSGDAIVDADGSLAEPPIALIEVQGYVYAAWLGMAELFERIGEPATADKLRAKARDLKARLQRDFWLPKMEYAAMALQADGQPCDVVASNPGQALWTGVLDPEQAAKIARRLLEPDMFSGWGIRTLSTHEKRYNPIGYHLGTVWPHDNAFIAAGLRRYGFDEAAMRVFSGIFEAASHFPNMRLPEVFAGFARGDIQIPVHYPVACHPQAWAAGSLPLLVQTILGLEADGFANRLRVRRPMLPPAIDRLSIHGIHIGRGTVDVTFERRLGATRCRVLRSTGDVEVDVDSD